MTGPARSVHNVGRSRQNLGRAKIVTPDYQPELQPGRSVRAEAFFWSHDDYPCEVSAWNLHADHEIHLITNASGAALVGDHIGRFEPGYVCIVGGGLPHDWVAEIAAGETIPKRDVVLQFSAERLRSAAALLPELAELDDFLTLSLRGLEFHGETRHRAAALLLRIGEATGAARLALFIELLAQLSASKDYVVLSSSDFVPKADADTIAMIDRVQSYIFEHLKSEIHMRDVADLVGMGESAFSRFFKRNCGNSFTDYVTRLRISQACGLLADSRIPITDVCFEVGYANISNFNRLFRKVHGMTPSAYRRLAGQRSFSKGARIRRGHRPDLVAAAQSSAA